MNIPKGKFICDLSYRNRKETEREKEREGEKKQKKCSLANVLEFLESKLVKEQDGLLYYCNPHAVLAPWPLARWLFLIYEFEGAIYWTVWSIGPDLCKLAVKHIRTRPTCSTHAPEWTQHPPSPPSHTLGKLNRGQFLHAIFTSSHCFQYFN